MRREQIGGDADIRHRTQTAGRHEREQSGHPPAPAQAPVPIRQQVVQPEVEDHRDDGRDRLCVREPDLCGAKRGEHGHVDEHAGTADQREGEEADRNVSADRLLRQQHPEVPDHQAVELALAVQALPERIGDFRHAQDRGRRGDDVEQNLEALPGQPAHARVERVCPDHEEPTHRIADLLPAHDAAQARGHSTHESPRLVPLADRAALRIAGGDHQLRPLDLQGSQHCRDPAFVVLQIGVHHHEHRRGAREHSLDAGRRESPAPDPANAPDPAVFGGDGFDFSAGLVRGIVVDEDHFPGDAAKRPLDARDQLLHVLALVERGHDDGHFERRGRFGIETTHGGRPGFDGRRTSRHRWAWLVLQHPQL